MIHTEFMKSILTGETKIPRYVPLILTVSASALGYAFDLQKSAPVEGQKYFDYIFDALYMTLITMTTIGYGDLSPGTLAGKLTGVPWMIFTTDLFASTFQSKEDLNNGYIDKPSLAKCSLRSNPEAADEDKQEAPLAERDPGKDAGENAEADIVDAR